MNRQLTIDEIADKILKDSDDLYNQMLYDEGKKPIKVGENSNA